MSESTRPPTPTEVRRARRSARAASMADAASGGWVVVLVKIIALAIIDALAVYAVLVIGRSGDWLVTGIIAVVTIAVNVIYFKRGLLPAKYLTPGLIFLAIFQIFVVLYSGYIAFTNYGTGHNSTKDDAIQAIMLQNQERVPDSAAYPLSVVESFGELSFLVDDLVRSHHDVGNRGLIVFRG